MPRLGSSRLSEHRLGGATGAVISRLAESYATTIQTASTRSNTVGRASTTYIPAEFNDAVGRLGDARLGSYRLGGGVSRGILTSAETQLTLPRSSDTYTAPIDTDATRLLFLNKTAETYVSPIDTNAIDNVPFWRVGGLQLRELLNETRTWETLTLEFRSNRDHVLSRLRPLDTDAGKLELLERSDGGFVAVDRVDGSNTFEVAPPTGRIPPRIAGDYLVDEYNEEIVDQQGNEYRVTVSLIPDEDRNTNSGYTETAGAGEWEFDFYTGTIATTRVHSELGTSGGSGTKSKRLTLILDADQVQVLEESASFLNAVRTREVPDGENVSEDNSPGDRNTVTVASPDEDVLESGDYVVQEWKSEMQNDRFQRVSLTLETSR